MKRKHFAILVFIFTLTMLVVQGAAAIQLSSPDHQLWTSWDAAHYFLIADGDYLWIGTGSGLLHYNKASGEHVRLSTAEDLPHRHFLSGAVGVDGSRWFGGDAGLSRLSATGDWIHFNRRNSELAGDQVTNIAVTEPGDLWISYQDRSTISRLHPDGTWQKYPNRETAVSLAFDNIKQTVNQNDLWTAAGDEVWVGFNAFDGSQWRDRTPANAWLISDVIVADSRDHVYAVGGIDYGTAVFEWDGDRWLNYDLTCDSCVDVHVSDLAVDEDDVVWVGGAIHYPYSLDCPAYGRLPDDPDLFSIDCGVPDVLTMIADMTATAEGLWISGPNWLLKPDGSMRNFYEVPYLENPTRLMIDGHGTTWLHTTDCCGCRGALQTLDDKGTGTLSDDSGVILQDNAATVEMAIAANGDLWLAWIEDALRFRIGHGPRRYIDGVAVDYETPYEYAFIYDIFVEDERRTWFVFEPYHDAGLESAGIWRLDDGGTPSDLNDDVWTTYEVSGIGADASVAARDGKLWYGDSTGVYLYNDSGWQPISSEGTEELIPAENGVLFASMSGRALVIEADGTQEWRSVPEIVLNNYDLVRSTTRRNKLWRNTADGAIWFWHFYGELARWDGRDLYSYDTPVYGGFIEVDQNEHIWLIEERGQWEDNTLWRISPRPDYRLSAGPSTWFITPNGSRAIAVGAARIEGYTNNVALSIKGLPEGVTAQLNPSEIAPGRQAVVTLTAHAAMPGTTAVTLHGVSGDISHEQKIKLAIVAETHDSWLPVMAYTP